MKWLAVVGAGLGAVVLLAAGGLALALVLAARRLGRCVS